MAKRADRLTVYPPDWLADLKRAGFDKQDISEMKAATVSVVVTAIRTLDRINGRDKTT